MFQLQFQLERFVLQVEVSGLQPTKLLCISSSAPRALLSACLIQCVRACRSLCAADRLPCKGLSTYATEISWGHNGKQDSIGAPNHPSGKFSCRSSSYNLFCLFGATSRFRWIACRSNGWWCCRYNHQSNASWYLGATCMLWIPWGKQGSRP